MKREAVRLLELIATETNSKIRIPYYDIHKICKSLGTSIPSMAEIIEKLKAEGFNAARTHFSGTGLRTDASGDKLIDIISKFNNKEWHSSR